MIDDMWINILMIDQWVNDGLTDGQMNGRTDGWMGECKIDGWWMIYRLIDILMSICGLID